MAITAKPYLAYFVQLNIGTHSVLSDTFKFALLSNAYTPNLLNDVLFSQISGNEVSGAGYTAGGEALTGVNLDMFGDQGIKITAAALTWAGLSATFRYAVLYNSSKGNNLVGYIDFGEDQVYTAADFTMSFSGGLITLVQAS